MGNDAGKSHRPALPIGIEEQAIEAGGRVPVAKEFGKSNLDIPQERCEEWIMHHSHNDVGMLAAVDVSTVVAAMQRSTVHINVGRNVVLAPVLEALLQ